MKLFGPAARLRSAATSADVGTDQAREGRATDPAEYQLDRFHAKALLPRTNLPHHDFMHRDATNVCNETAR